MIVMISDTITKNHHNNNNKLDMIFVGIFSRMITSSLRKEKQIFFAVAQFATINFNFIESLLSSCQSQEDNKFTWPAPMMLPAPELGLSLSQRRVNIVSIFITLAG